MLACGARWRAGEGRRWACGTYGARGGWRGHRRHHDRLGRVQQRWLEQDGYGGTDQDCSGHDDAGIPISECHNAARLGHGGSSGQRHTGAIDSARSPRLHIIRHPDASERAGTSRRNRRQSHFDECVDDAVRTYERHRIEHAASLAAERKRRGHRNAASSPVGRCALGGNTFGRPENLRYLHVVELVCRATGCADLAFDSAVGRR